MKILNRLIADVVYNNANTGLNAETLQQAIDRLYELVLPLLNNIGGGSPETLDSQFILNLDGGDPATEFEQNIDGGNPSSS
jgi:hypothetical protein